LIVKRDGWIYGLSGAIFGVLVGWILGTQQPGRPVSSAPPAAAARQQGGQSAPAIDTERAADLERQAGARPADIGVRTELANLYFDARRFDLAIPWYEAALKLDPKNVNVSTDLAVAYYSTNEIDRALKQADYSLSLDPNHLKTLLNKGIFLAFGKSDLSGAAAIWEKLVAIAPTSEEARIAREGLVGIKSSQGRAAEAQRGRGGTEAPR
jgi:cytochrome c-type biogenesis protein CcmH/NrfG